MGQVACTVARRCAGVAAQTGVCIMAVVAVVARLHKGVVDLPKNTFWRFMFRAEHLAMVHPAVSLWTRVHLELTTAVYSAHGQTRRAVQWEESDTCKQHTRNDNAPRGTPTTRSWGRWGGSSVWSGMRVKENGGRTMAGLASTATAAIGGGRRRRCQLA